ncbi:MAG: ribbon-helix-helix domain-containing protein [Desulfurococcaceae archaeon]
MSKVERKKVRRVKRGVPNRIVSFHAPEKLVEMMDMVVEMGLAQNRSELIRKAIEQYTVNMLTFYTTVKKSGSSTSGRGEVGYR